jgi:class 3 adenylate cyclase/tetratricopeptide (TPR) repeat protein
MQCLRCRHENRNDARFCSECGEAFGIRCAVCGTNLTVESKFCDNCGAPSAAIGTGRIVSPLFGWPNFHAPSPFAKRILTSDAALEGERKQVTVLFSDMKGSTEHIADRDPEDVRRLLDPVLELMMEAVDRYEGTVNQVMGDGIQALFGAPLAYEDHAIRACYAALKMQESIKKFADEVRRTEGLPLQIRVGLSSGEVLVRSLGSELHMNYSAHGETIHLAARMEQMAIPGTVLISSRTFHLTEGHVVTHSLGPMFVKGLSAPVEVYELLGAVAVSRLQALSTRGLTRFFGRENEMNQLQQAFDRSQAGHGQILVVVGEPGVGKSRLIQEFVHLGHTNSWRILQARAVSYGAATSYLPVTELLKDYFQLATSDEPGEIREKVTSKLLSLDAALLSTLPALLTLLGLPPDDLQSSPLDPQPQRRQRTIDAVKRLLLRESEEQPLCVVLEDLHSIDPETEVLINGIVDGLLPTARILLLVSCRPEYRHGWAGKTYYTQVRIDPLAPEIAGEMLNALVGTDRALEPLKRFLIEKTGGIPFFLEESVRALAETGDLIGKPAGYRATKSISELKIPATIEALLSSRIDRLAPVDKRLLQAAAVVGYQVPLSVLQAVADLSPEPLREGLKRLQASEFLYETSLFPDIVYTFKHALVHDAAYHMLSADRRRALHAAALTSGEKMYADILSEKADWLGFHAFRAEAWNRAVVHLQAAAAREIARAANRVAVQHLESALVAMHNLPVEERATLAIDLRIALRHALTPLGQVQRTLDYLRAAELLAIDLNDRPRLGRVVSFMANCLVIQARYKDALETGDRALNIARELDDHRLGLATNIYRARAMMARGDYRPAIGTFEEIIRELDEKPPNDFHGLPVLPATFARANLAACLAEVGAFEEAAAHASEAVRRADAIAQPDSIMWGYWSVGLVALSRGASGEAVVVFDRLLDVCRTHDLNAYASRIIAALGRTMARIGQVKEGLSLLEKAVELDASAEPQITRSFALTALSEAFLLAGEMEKALTVGTVAVQRTRAHGERGAEAHACWLLATIHSARHIDLDAAAGMFETATANATELGLLPLVTHCHLGLSDLHERRGLGEQATALQGRGQDLLDKMGMKRWFKL